MKDIVLTVSALLLLSAATSAVAWSDHDGYPVYSGYPEGYGHYRARPERPGVGYRSGVHIERGTYADGYLLRVYSRGMKPEDIQVSADRGRIRLRSEMSSQRTWQDEQRRSRMAGFSSFSRSIPLPRDADASRLEVTPADGVLEVRIPRR